MPFQACETLSERLCVQKVDKHSRTSHKLNLSMKSLNFSRLICALNLYFAKKKIAQNGNCSSGC